MNCARGREGSGPGGYRYYWHSCPTADSAVSESRLARSTSDRICLRTGSDTFSPSSYPHAFIDARIVNSVSLVSSVTLGVVCATEYAERIARLSASSECQKCERRKVLQPGRARGMPSLV